MHFLNFLKVGLIKDTTVYDAPHVMILPCLHFDVFGKCLLSLKSYNNAWYTKELSFFVCNNFQRGIEFLRPRLKIVKAYVYM